MSYRLLPKEHKAIKYYLEGLPKGQALKKAGFSFRAQRSPSRLFERPEIKGEIQRRQKMMATKANVNAEWIIERLASIADADLTDLMTLDEEGIPRIDFAKMNGNLRRAITGYSVKKDGKISVSQADKLKALDMLARHLGMYEDSLKIEGELSIVERLQEGRRRAHERNKKDD